MPNHNELGRRLQKAYNKDFIKAINNLTADQMSTLKKTNTL